MNKRKIFIILSIFIFAFIFKLNNVYAYIYKGEVWNTMSQYNAYGDLAEGATTTISFDINNSNINSVSVPYDLIVFKFNKLELRTSDNVSISGLVGGNGGAYWIPATSGGGTTGTALNTQGTSLNLTGLNTGNIYMQSTAYWGTNGDTLSCFFSSELEDQIICPIKKTTTTNLTKLELFIQNGGYDNLHYNLQLSGLKYYYNYEITDIKLEQQTTNTNLQYIYQQQQQNQQYLENDSTTGATTNMQSGFSDLSNSLNTELSSVNDLTQLVLAPISLMLDLSTGSCTPLHLQVPFVNYSVDLPCMSGIYTTYFGPFLTIFTSIVSAVYSYWIGVKTISLIKDIVDCDNDRLEVIDL